MASNRCTGCNTTIAGKEFLTCPLCKQKYDLQCANFTVQSFKAMTLEAKRKWECPECASKQPKGDNSNTPLRSHHTPEDVGHDHKVNVTLRNKPSKSSSSSAKDGELSPNYVTEDNLRTIIRQEFESIIKSSIKKFICEELKDIKVRLEEFQSSLTFNNKSFEELKKVNGEIKKTQSKLSADLKAANEENSNLKANLVSCESRIKHLEEEHARQQQWTRLQNIELVGVPENSQENTADVVKQVMETIGVQVESGDIEFAHRVQPRRTTSAKRGRAIVVKLKHRAIKDKIIAASRKHRNVTARDIGRGGENERMYINEHLTRENKALLASCKLKAKEFSYKYIWTKNCRIFVRKNDTSPPILISSSVDLAKIL